MKHIEVEIKFPLLNAEELAKELDNIGSDKKEQFQKDTYFNHPHKNFLIKPIREWLRVRESKKGCSINYKNWHVEKNTNSCDEFETGIQSKETMETILHHLGFIKIITVQKARKSWLYKNTEIAIDKVNELGYFIEIEAKGNFETIEDARAHIYKILDEIKAKVGQQDLEGYPVLLLKKRGLM